MVFFQVRTVSFQLKQRFPIISLEKLGCTSPSKWPQKLPAARTEDHFPPPPSPSRDGDNLPKLQNPWMRCGQPKVNNDCKDKDNDIDNDIDVFFKVKYIP